MLAYLREQAEALKWLDPMVRRGEPDSVHQMRVATGRLRSTLRSFGRGIRRAGAQWLAYEKAHRFAKQMKKVQSVLGDHKDAAIGRQIERDLGISAHLAGENAFTYGLLYERDAHDAERLQTGPTSRESGHRAPLSAVDELAQTQATMGRPAFGLRAKVGCTA